jgi:hypothetical protein
MREQIHQQMMLRAEFKCAACSIAAFALPEPDRERPQPGAAGCRECSCHFADAR